MVASGDIRRSPWHSFGVPGVTLALVAFALAGPPLESQEPATASVEANVSKPRPPRKLSPSEVEAFEKKVADNPNDLESRERLLTHYFTERNDAVRAVRARHGSG